MDDASAPPNTIERRPLINNAGAPQPSQKRHRASNWLSIPTKRRFLPRRTTSGAIFSYKSEKGYKNINISTNSLPTCHEEGSTTSLSLSDADPISECSPTHWQPGILTRIHDTLSLTLENQGSVARDHLASERTFLAYVRTSLSLASAGVALVQLYAVATENGVFHKGHRMHRYIRPLGGLTIGMGLMVMMIGVIRYFVIQQALTQGYFPVSRAATAFIAISLMTLVMLTFSILIAGKLEPKGLYH